MARLLFDLPHVGRRHSMVPGNGSRGPDNARGEHGRGQQPLSSPQPQLCLYASQCLVFTFIHLEGARSADLRL
jgi:hypothetical protein